MSSPIPESHFSGVEPIAANNNRGMVLLFPQGEHYFRRPRGKRPQNPRAHISNSIHYFLYMLCKCAITSHFDTQVFDIRIVLYQLPIFNGSNLQSLNSMLFSAAQ